MFRQLKSALIWYYLYRFRRRIALILTLVVLLFLSEYLYSDIVEYLQLRHKLEWLDYILPLKWLLIVFLLFSIFYLLLTIFHPPQEPKSQETPKKRTPSVDNSQKLSRREIRDLAREIIQRKKGRR
ncbi:MAG: hypothetical protein C6I00_01705 [Nitratiruptor sp.]|nr:hypothetical protein [Nitratiruptor sp.]NPA83314.1 hypothetical protein [Campylobacterota bacterium]